MLAHAAGLVVAMVASLVSVTTRGLLDCPLAPTVSALERVWELPLELVEKAPRV